ncbi:restriction endonuclease subunit S [Marinobacter sp. MIT932201]|uniref:restriction endonuclease subunit S n=1 Tax=Marinobacter sp. MIT932201 TaxID=3096995 RepID=UPI00399A0D66
MASNPSTHLGELFKSSRKKGEAGLPLLSVTLNNGLIVRDQLDRRTETNLEASEHLLVQSGDIAYNMMRVWQGALGRASVNGLVSPAYVVLRPTAKIDSLYAEYLFKTPRMIYLFWAYSYGLTKDRLRLYFNDFARIPVTIPDIKEQRKIAKILSTWDKAITTTEQLLANSQEQKKALMQQLLTGKKRLLDKNGVRFNGEFKRYHFSDLLEIDRKSLGSKTDPNLEFDYISLSDVGTGTILGALERHIFKTSPSRARRIVSPGDILLATVRPNLQGFAKVREQHEHCIASTGFAVLTPKKGTCGDYVYHYLFGSHITGQINALVVGTNYPAINSSDVSGLCIYCPHYEEQIEIAKVLNSSDELINALQQKLEALKQEKISLMQQLLTGKRRVKIDNKEVA